MTTELTDAERDIMAHAVGWPKMYRNHYALGEGGAGWGTIQGLVGRGLMEVRRPADPLFGQMTIFGVTQVGELRLRESMRGGGR